MPLYDYMCGECHVREEHLVGPERPANVRCPTCGGQATREIGLPNMRAGERPPMDNPWVGAVSDPDEFVERSRDYQDKRRERGYIPPRETRIQIDAPRN